VYLLADTVCIDPVPTTANHVPRETFLLRIAGSINCCMKRRHRRKVVHMLRPFRRPLSQKTGPAIRSSYWLVTAAAGRAAARRIPGLSTYAAAPRMLTNTGCTALHVLPANEKELTTLNGFVADQFVYMKQGSSSVLFLKRIRAYFFRVYTRTLDFRSTQGCTLYGDFAHSNVRLR